MFTTKKAQLFEKSSKPTSAFVEAATKELNTTTSENGAKKYKSTGSALVDQFKSISVYKAPRSFNDIAADCELLYAQNRKFAILFIFFVRMITRVVTLYNGGSTKTSQKGGEMKHEGIMRMIWLHFKEPKTFWSNIGIFIAVGSWKDIITMLQYDLIYNGWENRKLDWNQFAGLILGGLENSGQRELLKKYLPQIKANSKCNTVEAQADNIIAKWICSLLYGNKESAANYKKYRKLKTSGTAHEWQKLISQSNYEALDFSKIHGRALSILVKSKTFLTKSGLKEKYTEWVAKPTTEVKFTGFVHEIFKEFSSEKIFDRTFNQRGSSMSLVEVPQYIQDTVNKQFATLISKAGPTGRTRLIVVRDTSGSMASMAPGTDMSCYDVAKAIALYFSEFLKGPFENSWIEFNSKAQMHSWKGRTPLEKWFNDNSGFYGSTNFQSVVDLFCELRAHGLAESDFPTGILCISDSEFNPSGSINLTNYEMLQKKLSAYFSREYVDNFAVILWNLQRSDKYHSETASPKIQNMFYFGGYNPATISFLTSEIKNAQELAEEALNQEVLQMVSL